MRVESITKEEQIRNIILGRVSSGQYRENEKIKSIRDLASEFQVSKLTIQQVVSNLTLQNILRSEHGRGTFVVPRHEQPVGKRLVGILMNTTGDLNAPLSSSIIRELQRQGCHPVVLDTSMHSDASSGLAGRLEELIASQPLGIIVNGWNEIESSEIVGMLNSAKKVACVLSLHPKYKGMELQVLSDYAWGHYIGVRHLLELGHRNVLVIPSTRILYPRMVAMLKGCRKAFKEFGVDWDLEDRFISSGNEAEDIGKMAGLFTRKERPTAVFASMDFLAVRACRAAAKAGLKIPEDLSVVGYFNTPWAEQVDPPMTSVSVKETEIGECVVRELLASSWTGRRKKIVFKPELVLRKSTGPNKLNPGI